MIAGFDSIFEVQRALYANAVQALNELQAGGAGRAPALEQASQVLIVLIGFWLLWRAFRPHLHRHDGSAPLLAIVTGLIPCPLTTFIMTYAAAHGAIKWGLLLSALFAVGMTFTVALFPLTAVLARTRFLPLVARTDAIRNRVASAVEVCAAIAVIAIGALPLLRQLNF